MGTIVTTGGAGGAASDECTAKLSDIPKGLIAVTADSNDEPGTGTMELTGNAQVGHVLSGKTFYATNYKSRLTGAMTVNSLLSFSVAAYSGRRVLAKWQNPKAAGGKPYSGVYIRYSTSGYPGKTGGTQIYKGAGNNTASEGQSQAYLDLPALNTTYYLSVYPYVTCSAGEMAGDVRNTSVKTSAILNVTIKATQNYSIPAGYSKLDVFAVGGGGGGGGGYGNSGSSIANAGGGAGGGYTKTVKGIGIAAGQTISCTVGAGGAGASNSSIGNTGGTSSAVRSGVVLCSSSGGFGGNPGYTNSAGGDGGSGGGGGGWYDYETPKKNGYAGGSDGRNGAGQYGKGQGSTTRLFGESSGSLYAGGGGGGGGVSSPGAGGAGGGGNGGGERLAGSAGAVNTGGGGGGGWADKYATNAGGKGGSGVIALRLY